VSELTMERLVSGDTIRQLIGGLGGVLGPTYRATAAKC
jgi:hypothetical protein